MGFDEVYTRNVFPFVKYLTPNYRLVVADIIVIPLFHQWADLAWQVGIVALSIHSFLSLLMTSSMTSSRGGVFQFSSSLFVLYSETKIYMFSSGIPSNPYRQPRAMVTSVLFWGPLTTTHKEISLT